MSDNRWDDDVLDVFSFHTSDDFENVVDKNDDIDDDFEFIFEAITAVIDDELEVPHDTVTDIADIDIYTQNLLSDDDIEQIITDSFDEEDSPFSWKKELLSWAIMFVCAFAIAFIIDNFFIVNATVPTGSMQNTIMAGDRMIGWRLSYKMSEPERGDVIIFKYPDDPSQKYVKRVIGLPGETVTITKGNIYINDDTEPLVEDYLPENWVWKNDGFTFIVPQDCYFVLGDNRNNSHDARSWTNTYVTKDAILGKALFCYWPLDSIKKID